jgi:hypothetical protein
MKQHRGRGGRRVRVRRRGGKEEVEEKRGVGKG